MTHPQVTSPSGYPAGFTRLPPGRGKGRFKPESLEMLVMWEQWGQRMESLALDTGPVFTNERGWDHKVLSLSSLSRPCRASVHDREVGTTAVFHLLAQPGQQLPPPSPPTQEQEFQSLRKVQSSSPASVSIPQGKLACVEHCDFIGFQAARGGDLTVSVSVSREDKRGFLPLIQAKCSWKLHGLPDTTSTLLSQQQRPMPTPQPFATDGGLSSKLPGNIPCNLNRSYFLV